MRECGQIKLTDMRPPLVGFDQWVAGLTMVSNQLISLRIERGNSSLKHIEGPLFPMEIANERLRKFTTGKRNTAIERAQEHSRRKREQRELEAVNSA